MLFKYCVAFINSFLTKFKFICIALIEKFNRVFILQRLCDIDLNINN